MAYEIKKIGYMDIIDKYIEDYMENNFEHKDWAIYMVIGNAGEIELRRPTKEIKCDYCGKTNKELPIINWYSVPLDSHQEKEMGVYCSKKCSQKMPSKEAKNE